MIKAYKIVISLTALLHFGGFIQAAFMPADFLLQFGAEYNDSLLRITTHFGFLLLIFASIQTLAVVWTFKGKIEGIQLGLVAGLVMLLTFILDLILIKDVVVDYPLLAFGGATAITAYFALRNSKSLQKK